VKEVISVGLETSKGVIGDSEESGRYVVEIGNQMWITAGFHGWLICLQCYALNWGWKDHKCAPGPIM